MKKRDKNIGNRSYFMCLVLKKLDLNAPLNFFEVITIRDRFRKLMLVVINNALNIFSCWSSLQLVL